jgi:hypothetical protein
MKITTEVEVEIENEHIIADVRDCIDSVVEEYRVKKSMDRIEIADFLSAREFARAANVVLKWYGGEPIDLSALDF